MFNNNTDSYNFGDSMKLAPKIIILLLVVTFGVMSLYSFFQIKKAEKSFNADAESNHVLLLSNSLGFLSKSLWELDKDIAARGMKPLFEAETVINIQIFDSEGHFFSGYQYKIGADNKKELIESEEKGNEKDINNNELKKIKRNYDSVPSKMVSQMQNLPDGSHRLIGSLWWKETDLSDPKFLGYVVLNFSTEYIQKRLLEQKISFILFTFALSCTILLLTYAFLKKQIINPIQLLMEASLDIANGKFTKIKDKFRYNIGNEEDEIDKLTTNFNFMVDKIEHSLLMIKGLSEAAQAIVKCMNIEESVKIYEKYLKELIKLNKLEVWLNIENEALNNPKGIIRISDKLQKENLSPLLDKILSSKELVFESSQLFISGDYINNSILLFPLLNSKNILVGVVEVFFPKNINVLSQESLGILNTLSTSLITAVENEWHVIREKNRANLERDIELASAVQDSIISKNFPNSKKFDCSIFFKTASQCGGDWFGIYEVDENRILVLFGDVTGHGTPAALITAVTRGSADMLFQFVKMGNNKINNDFPSQVLKFINECIVDTGRQTYLMTMVAALIDFNENKIFASSAGHTPPAIVDTNTDKTEVKYIYPAMGSRLGFTKGSDYETKEFDFLPGQKIVFYTDGIVEGESPQAKEYGLKNFKRSMESHGQLDPSEFIKNVTNDAFKYFDGIPQKDDIALLAIRFLKSTDTKIIADVA